MTPDPAAAVALYYDPDGYVEHLGPQARPVAGGPRGLMGRQVAGREFLDAYMAHGRGPRSPLHPGRGVSRPPGLASSVS